MRLLFSLLLLSTLFTACGPAVIYEKEQTIDAAGWAYADSVRFAFHIPSTEQAYDYVLSLEHAENFPYQNFYVQLHTGFPSGKRRTEQVSLQMAGDFGEWYGDCGGETCRQEITILQNARFKATGDYHLTVEQHSRDTLLQGIGAVGLKIVERK